MSATWPSAWVTVDADGVRVSLWTGWCSRLAMTLLGVGKKRSRWFVAWPDLRVAATTGSDVFLHAAKGEHVRVTFPSLKRTDELLRILRRHDVPVRFDGSIRQARKR